MNNKSKQLTKETIKRFSISYNKAKTLGITDEDLKYISEIGEDKYRISIRVPDKDRYTEVVYGLLNAINRKWEVINSLSKDTKLDKQEKQFNLYSDLTVQEGFDKYFEFRKLCVEKKKLERTTLEKDIEIYQGRHIRECKLLNKKIIEVTEEDTQNYVDELFLATRLDTDILLSENTINNPYALFHRLFEYFINKLKIINSNPFDSVDRKPKYKPKKRDYLANVDIKYVLDEVEKKNIRFKTFINLFLETGLRIEEIVAIKYSDINRMRMTIKISRALVKSRLTGELIIKDLKTDDSEREISISLYTLDLIDNLRDFKEHCGIMITNDDFIFTSWFDNELIDPKRFSDEWNRFIKDLGYKNLPLRIIRHSSATFMLQGETNIEAVKRRFGWSKLSTVMGVYNQSNLEEDRKLLNKFDEEFRNTLGLSYEELFCICVDRFNNKRKINSIIQKLLLKPIDQINYEEDLKICQKYLFDIYPVFTKIAKISDELDDEEINAIFVGFKPIYKKIKIEPLEIQRH